MEKKTTIGKYPILTTNYREVSGSIGKYRESIGKVSEPIPTI